MELVTSLGFSILKEGMCNKKLWTFCWVGSVQYLPIAYPEYNSVCFRTFGLPHDLIRLGKGISSLFSADSLSWSASHGVRTQHAQPITSTRASNEFGTQSIVSQAHRRCDLRTSSQCIACRLASTRPVVGPIAGVHHAYHY